MVSLQDPCAGNAVSGYKHDMFFTPSRIWEFLDAHFTQQDTKAININLITLRAMERVSNLVRPHSHQLNVTCVTSRSRRINTQVSIDYFYCWFARDVKVAKLVVC